MFPEEEDYIDSDDSEDSLGSQDTHSQDTYPENQESLGQLLINKVNLTVIQHAKLLVVFAKRLGQNAVIVAKHVKQLHLLQQKN